jgi:hypothetical protein
LQRNRLFSPPPGPRSATIPQPKCSVVDGTELARLSLVVAPCPPRLAYYCEARCLAAISGLRIRGSTRQRGLCSRVVDWIWVARNRRLRTPRQCRYSPSPFPELAHLRIPPCYPRRPTTEGLPILFHLWESINGDGRGSGRMAHARIRVYCEVSRHPERGPGRPAGVSAIREDGASHATELPEPTLRSWGSAAVGSVDCDATPSRSDSSERRRSAISSSCSGLDSPRGPGLRSRVAS